MFIFSYLILKGTKLHVTASYLSFQSLALLFIQCITGMWLVVIFPLSYYKES